MPPCMDNLDALSDCNSGDAPHPTETLSWSDPTVSHVTKGVALRETTVVSIDDDEQLSEFIS